MGSEYHYFWNSNSHHYILVRRRYLYTTTTKEFILVRRVENCPPAALKDAYFVPHYREPTRKPG